MLSRDYTDIAGGVLLATVGLGFAVYSWAHYDLGTITRMGPGMFPAGLGVLLAIFGVAQAIPAFFRSGTLPAIRIVSPIFVLASVAAFALLLRTFGLLPAVFAVVVISSFAEFKFRPLTVLLLAGALCLMSWLIFSVGLRMAIPMFRWGF